MKKIMSIAIISIMIISGLGVNALQFSDAYEKDSETQVITLSEPVFSNMEEYASVHLEEATSTLLIAGKPALPVVSKTFTYPAGTVIRDVSVSFDVENYNLDKKIQPSPKPVPLTDKITVENIYEQDNSVYESSSLYPDESYQIRKGVGIKDGEHVLYVTIDCYTQYAPALDTLYVPNNIDLKVTYEPATQSFITADEHDMLIITTEEFKDHMQPLVDHKNANGISTIVDTVENIYSSYNGRDNPEDIKLRIKDAIEEWGIEYVLIAGGRDGQTHGWHVPSRTTNNDDGWEAGYESDLYYADIYKINEENETVFEDWDSDGDDIFAEFGFFGDKMDYYPDVSVGRLPFRYTSEIEPVVNKIINYETNADDSWFKKGIVVSGDTFPPSRGGAPGWWEGEMGTKQTVDSLENEGFTMEKLWLSIPGAWEGPEDVINAISAGAGFVHFAGHSNPASWGNHPPDDEEHVFIDGIRIWDMPKLSNDGKYPVVMLGGCHSAQFNVTMANILSGIKEYGLLGYFFTSPMRFFYYEWVPHDLSSLFVITPSAGSIGSMGNTGLGYGYVGEFANAGLGGWLDPRFFDAYTNQSIDVLGPAHDKSIVDYINIIGNVNSDQIDRKSIEEHVLLGDPSLKMGGL
ncbi:MAG: peptidase C25 [Candidatus Thermoplasmatota archaeon]|nr:peptidase C25 [Candidatus Thermoplasmatota archaeon]